MLASDPGLSGLPSQHGCSGRRMLGEEDGGRVLGEAGEDAGGGCWGPQIFCPFSKHRMLRPSGPKPL